MEVNISAQNTEQEKQFLKWEAGVDEIARHYDFTVLNIEERRTS